MRKAFLYFKLYILGLYFIFFMLELKLKIKHSRT